MFKGLIIHEVFSEHYLGFKCEAIITVGTIFSSGILSVALSPLGHVAKAIYQLCTNIFKGLVQKRVSGTLGVAVVHESNYFPESPNNLNVFDRYM